MANYINHDLKREVELALGEYAQSHLVKSSAGSGNWAAVPWVAVFNPLVTKTATQGYYIVYLFSPSELEVHLSLNQGFTAIKHEFGAKRGKDILRERARIMRARIGEFDGFFDTYKLNLGSSNQLPQGYEAGHAIGRKYELSAFPSEADLQKDLNRLVKAYWCLIRHGGILAAPGEDDLRDETEPEDLIERKQYRFHRRIERNSSAAEKAKKALGYKCMACCFHFAKEYGELGKRFIEAHHLTPIGELEEGITVSLDPRKDFAVLCSNCHRMIHRTDDPSDLEYFRGLIKYTKKYSRSLK